MTDQSLRWLRDRNHDIEAGDGVLFGYHSANLELQMPVLPNKLLTGATPYDRTMQLMFVALVLAARGEIWQFPYFGPGTFEEATNRGWVRDVASHIDDRVTTREQIALFEVRVTVDGDLGATGIFFAIPEGHSSLDPIGVRQDTNDATGDRWEEVFRDHSA